MLMHLLKIFTMHRDTAQLLVTVLEFDKKIKFLQRRECLSSVPHSDHLMPTQHCIQWVPAAVSLDIMHPVQSLALASIYLVVPWSTICGPLLPLTVQTYMVQSFGTMTTSLCV